MRLEKYTGILLVLGVLGAASCSTEIRYAAGVIAPNDPVQIELDTVSVMDVRGYHVQRVARFEVEARVLGKTHYRFDPVADLSPVDLALGWGPMSDQGVLDKIDISQSGRFYRWRVRSYPIPREEIIQHSANMHMIPANDAVHEDLLKVRVGEVVVFRGYLVTATTEDGKVWRSSFTRKDTGNGACEVVLVEGIVSYEKGILATNMDSLSYGFLGSSP
ncbi:MAG: hypothetical protein ACE5G0_02545 [Rhodothermales bacterium]